MNRTKGHVDNIGGKPALTNPNSGGSFSRYIKPEHKAMSRMLGYCLTVAAPDLWSGFGFLASVRLTVAERAALAFSALNSLDPDQAQMTAAAVVESAGQPLPAFLGGMDDARFWASCANPAERKAYALAAYEAMNTRDQAAFFRHISELEIAA